MNYMTQAQYSKAMRDNLSIVDPEISTGLGTFARKLIDIVSSQLSNGSVDSAVGQYSFDVNSYSGSDLDAYLSLFGFSRQAETYAVGTVTLSRYSADTPISVNPGDQFYRPSDSTSGSIAFQSLTYVTMDINEVSVDVPVIAIVGGSTGNVVAGSVTGSSTMTNIVVVTNSLPMTGGQDQEGDITLRARFTSTVFRNVAGTKDQYMALALTNAFTRRANLVGQSSMSSELLTVASAGNVTSALSANAEVASVIDNVNGVWLQDANMTDSYFKEGVDYVLDTTTLPPKVVVSGTTHTSESVTLTSTTPTSVLFAPIRVGSLVVKNSGGSTTYTESTTGTNNDYVADYVDGTIKRTSGSAISTGATVKATYTEDFIGEGTTVILEYEYLSTLNRGVGRNVELYMDGVDLSEATEERFFNGATTFGTTKTSSTVVKTNWKRLDDTTPTTGNYFESLTVQPVTDLPSSIEFPGGASLLKGTDYWFVQDITSTNGSTKSQSGIEFLAASMTSVMNQPYTITYPNNPAVGTVQALVDSNSQVTSSCLVHQCKTRYFQFTFDVMYSMFPKTSIDSAIQDSINSLLSSVSMGSYLQVSDLESTVHAVEGVDSVKLATSGIQEYAADGVTLVGSAISSDIKLGGNEIPAMLTLVTISHTQEIWGH